MSESVKMHRISSAGSARGGGARSNEVVLLQGTVEALKQELHYSRVEIARVSDQLNCLIMLVKRWVESAAKFSSDHRLFLLLSLIYVQC